MLNSDLTMQNINKQKTVVWTEKEWNDIAQELKRKHPKNSFVNYHNLSITIEDFEEAMEAVILQERQKSFSEFTEFRRPIFDAFIRISEENKSKPKLSIVEGHVDGNGHIKWSPQEWEVVVLEFNRINPGSFEEKLVKLKTSQIRDAVEILPLHRRRYFAQLDLFRSQALKTWEQLPAEVKNNGLQNRMIVDFSSGPVMEPPIKTSDKENAIATAMHEAFKKSDRKPESKKRVYWTEEEWLSIAKEMHRQNPHAGFLTSNFFNVDLEAVRLAQRQALPIDLRRHLHEPKKLRLPLVEAFRVLKAEQDKKPIPETKIVEKPAIKQPEAKEPILEAVKESPVPQAVQERTEVDFLSKVLNAAAPLMDLLVTEVAQRITPDLIKALMPAIQTAMKDLQKPVEAVKPALITHNYEPIQEATSAAPARPIDAQEAPTSILSAPYLEKPVPPTEKPKKQLIGVLGPFGQQKTEIEKSFPEYNFLFIENGRGFKEAGHHCSLFVAAIPYCNRANKDSIKAHIAPDKVRYVDGGVSMIKRQIDIWKLNQK